MNRLASIQASRATLLWITFLGFAAFGLSEAQLGVAWPTLRDAFHVPTDALGVLIAAGVAGLLLGSLWGGWLIGWMGIWSFLSAGTFVRGLGLLGFAVAGQWWLLVTAAFIAGLGAGFIASGSNTLLATRYNAGLMSWMHASFGLGSMFGPLLMTGSLGSTAGYASAYLVVGWIALAIGVLFAVLSWSEPREAAINQPAAARVKGSGALALLRWPVAWLGLLTFFLYRGLEISAGQWTFTLFTDSRAASVAVAGVSVGLYWAGLTLGRILYGLTAHRIQAYPLLRVAGLGVLAGLVLLFLNLSTLISMAGLVLLGFGMAPIFPLLSADTTRRVGKGWTATAVGFQIAIGSLGGAVIPGLGGLLGGRFGLESIGILLIIVCVLLLGAIELLARARRVES